MSLLQIRSTLFSPRSPSLAMLLLNSPSRGTLPRFSRPLIMCNNDESNHTALVNGQSQINEDIDTHKNISFQPTESTVSMKMGEHGHMEL